MAKNFQQYVLKNFDLERDYMEYARWWNSANKRAITPSELPKNGVSVFKGDKLIACGFLFLTDSVWGVLGFWRANPSNKALDTYKSMILIIEGCKKIAMCNGISQIFANTLNRGMIKLLQKSGFENFNGHLRWDYGWNN